jgi:monoamine oxidase
MSGNRTSPSRRSLLSMVGVVAGSAAMYHAMTELGYAEGSTFTGPIKLSPPPPGTTVLVLGAGVAGMVAAMLWTALTTAPACKGRSPPSPWPVIP